MQTQEVQAGGKGSIYPITITNDGGSAASIQVNPVVGDWGSATVSPSNVLVVDGGQSTTAYVQVAADAETQPGQAIFAVTVSSGGEVVEQLTLSADIVASESESEASGLQGTLEVVLVVILILLVLLGLIVGFRKLATDESEEDDDSYY